MWVKTKDGRYYNFDRSDAMFVREDGEGVPVLSMYIGGTAFILGHYKTEKMAQEVLDDIFDALVDEKEECIIYEM